MDDLFEQPEVSNVVKQKTISKFKPLPVFIETRERVKAKMMKTETYEIFINKLMDLYDKVQTGDLIEKPKVE